MFAFFSSMMGKAAGYDADAKAFFEAGVDASQPELSDTIKDALSALFVYWKLNNVFNKISLYCPYVGGTAVWHSLNSINPSEQVTFSGSPTHNANGVTFSGSGQWVDYGYARSGFAVDSFGMGFYSRTAGVTGYDMGIEDTSGANKSIWIGARLSGDRFQNAFGSIGIDTTETDGRGFFFMSAVPNGANTDVSKYKNATRLNTTAVVTATTGLSTRNVFGGALNSNGSANYYSNRNQTSAILTQGLTEAEAIIVYTGIINFETAIGRNI